jgi:hypothetical protein
MPFMTYLTVLYRVGSFEGVPIGILRIGLNSANPQAFADNMRKSPLTAPIHSEYQSTLFAPREEANARAGVGASRVPVTDIRREEFNVTPASLFALTGDQRRRQGSVLEANERTRGGMIARSCAVTPTAFARQRRCEPQLWSGKKLTTAWHYQVIAKHALLNRPGVD